MEEQQMAAEIKTNKVGPYVVKGNFKIINAEGKNITPESKDTVFLCSCGKSKNKPYCDGSHAKE
jgi:CDGSH-type Zn-finger protein